MDAFGIDRYEIFIDDKKVSDNNTYLWDTTKYADGTYKVKVNVYDLSGNMATVTNTYELIQNFVPYANQFPKVMEYNIKESGIFPEWIEVMKEENADVVMLVETGNFDDNSDAQLKQVISDLNAYFFDELPYDGYTLQGIENAWNGITLLSRFDISNAKKIDTVKRDDGSSISVPLPFLSAVLDIGGQSVNIIGAHLTCCTDGNIPRLNEQEGIINYMDDLGDVPIIYLGDMNSESPDDTNETASDLGVGPIDMILNQSNPKSSKVHTFTDVHIAKDGDSPGYSFGGFSRIDYIFVNQKLKDLVVSSTTGDTPSADRGSDHVTVDAVFDYSGSITIPTFETYTPPVESTTSTNESTPTTSSVSTSSEKAPFIVSVLLIGLVVLPITRRIKK